MKPSRCLKYAVGVGAGAAALAAGRLAHALPEPEKGGIGMPRDVSVNGWKIDHLIDVTNIFVIVMLAAILTWLLTAVFVWGKNHKAVYTDGGKKAWVFPVGLALFIFFVVDGNLFVNSTMDMHDTFDNFAKVEKDPKTVRIQLNAQQWAWNARYAGPDGQFNTKDDIVTLNDIRVPVNRPVLFQIGSRDVIHSFYLPNLRVKKDAMPGMINRTWFKAKETGQFDIACAQHCGTHHYKMKGELTILPEEEYEVWAAEASADSARRYDPKDERAHWGWEWKI